MLAAPVLRLADIQHNKLFYCALRATDWILAHLSNRKCNSVSCQASRVSICRSIALMTSLHETGINGTSAPAS